MKISVQTRLMVITVAFVTMVIAATVLAVFAPDSSFLQNLIGAISTIFIVLVDALAVAKKDGISIRPPKGKDNGGT